MTSTAPLSDPRNLPVGADDRPRMFVLPPQDSREWYEKHQPALVRWCEEQGIEPGNVVLGGQHWTARDDGTYTWHYLEFLLDGEGKRILCPSEQDDYEYGGEHTYWAKRPRVIRVNSMPDGVVEVGR